VLPWIGTCTTAGVSGSTDSDPTIHTHTHTHTERERERDTHTHRSSGPQSRRIFFLRSGGKPQWDEESWGLCYSSEGVSTYAKPLGLQQQSDSPRFYSAKIPIIVGMIYFHADALS